MEFRKGTISSKTIEGLALVITGGSYPKVDSNPGKYRGAWELEKFFKGIDVDFQINGKSRVQAVQNCLEEINIFDPDKIVEVIQAVCDTQEYIDCESVLDELVLYMNKRLKYDRLKLEKQGEFYRLTTTVDDGLPVGGLQKVIDLTDYESVQTDFARALDAADKDPADAITSACSTVESVCKCLLDKMGQPYPSKQSIQNLVTEVGKHLNLSPARKDLHEILERDVKQVLSGLISVTSGIGALRTHSGDAHGRGLKQTPVDSRIARLAIHSASTVSLFYIATYNRMCSVGV